MVKRPTPFSGIDLIHEEEGILPEGCKNPESTKRLKIWIKNQKVGLQRRA